MTVSFSESQNSIFSGTVFRIRLDFFRISTVLRQSVVAHRKLCRWITFTESPSFEGFHPQEIVVPVPFGKIKSHGTYIEGMTHTHPPATTRLYPWAFSDKHGKASLGIAVGLQAWIRARHYCAR